MPTSNTPSENPALNQAEKLMMQPDLEQRKELIRQSTAKDLNEYARLVSLQKNVLLPQEKEEVRLRMEQLAAETQNKLELLKQNVHLSRVVEEKAVKPTIAEQEKKESFLGKAKEYAKSVPWAGDFLATLIPEQMPSLERMWLKTISTPGLVGSMLGEGFLKNWLTGMSANAMRRLAELDVADMIKEESYVGESITFSTSENAWKAFIAKNEPTPITELAKQYIELKREEHRSTPDQPFILSFGVADLLKMEEMKKQIAEQRTSSVDSVLRKKVEVKFGATSVAFGTDTKFEDGVLTLKKDDVDANGDAKPGSSAEVMLKAKNALEGVEVIEFVKGPVAIEWDSDKSIAKIPTTTKVDLKLLREIAIMGEPNGISRVVVEKKDSFTQEQIQRVLDGGTATLLVPNNPVILRALPSAIRTLVNPDNIGRNATWQLMNGNSFVEIDKPAPSKAG